jgi:tetratricopeptide (TPR) repeat protein
MSGGIRVKRFWRAVVMSVLIVGTSCAAMAESASKVFEKANAAYKAGKYEAAIGEYESILKTGKENAELHYNLGNCYYKTEHLGKSILHYEKALKLAPDDEDVAHNLKLANSQTIDKLIPVPQLAVLGWWQNFRQQKTSSGWGWYALSAIWISLIAFAAYLFTSFKRTGFFLGSFFLISSLFLLYLRMGQKQVEEAPDAAILLAESFSMKSAPGENSTDIFMIHEGIKLQVQDKVGEWYKVRLTDGKVGWVSKSAIGLI